MAELNQLIRKRGVIKAQLTRFATFIGEFVDDFSQLELRLEKCEQSWHEFNSIQGAIEELVPSEQFEIQTRERLDFEDHYFNIVSQAKKLLSQNFNTAVAFSRTGSDRGSLHTVQNGLTNNVKLPRIELPTFSGSYEHWLAFYDTFDSLINKNTELPDIQKFYYLRSSLKGEASEVIESLEVSNENYRVAWDLLKDRFQNRKLITHNHIKALFNIEPITKESHIFLRKLLDSVLKNMRALKVLGQPTEHWDALLIYLVCTKLDNNTKCAWEFENKSEFPTFSELADFLSKRCQLLETTSTDKRIATKPFHKFPDKPQAHHTKSFMSNNIECPICKQAHGIFHCTKFNNLSPSDKYSEIRRLKICSNCLKSGHFSQQCTGGNCKKCNKKHNTLLHIDNYSQNQKKHSNAQISSDSTSNNSNENVNLSSENSVNSVTTHSSSHANLQTILSTAIIHIIDNTGKIHEARALLDCGSQSNFITEQLCEKLNLQKQRFHFSVGGINQTITNINHYATAIIKSRFNSYREKLSFLVLGKITENLPLSTFNVKNLKIPQNITLADADYNKPGAIDILLGAPIFWDLLCVGQIKLGRHLPTLHKTKLGWVMAGTIPEQPNNKIICNFSSNLNNMEVQQQLEKFWQIEECEQHNKYSKEEQSCEEHYATTHIRENDGRFQVTLPMQSDISDLGESRETALKRLLYMEKKFQKQPDLKEKYTQFMQEYLQLGHMECIEDQGFITFAHYLPHHAVFKESSSTTKLRVVFDGSAKTSTGNSLNDVLSVGPVVQEDLFSILTRFRKHQYVITADIEKMYRQINIDPKQRDVQRILWRFNSDDDIKEYRLNTVTYGLSSSAFLATRCLKQLGMENQDANPMASESILRDFYVDDLITGSNTIHGAETLKRDITSICKQGQFHLRKWRTNYNTNKISSLQIQDTNTDSKTLGLAWDCNEDIFTYNPLQIESARHVTKRTILSTVSQIFDPLGLIGPVTVKAKLFIQHLWKLNLNWDEGVPTALHTEWLQFLEQLKSINRISIPRKVICSEAVELELHGFSDSSELAYGAALYIRSTNSHGKHFVKLLCAKSRVAPLKSQSLPRLELCGCVLLAKLYKVAKQAINIQINKTYFWCDSTIALTWIKGEPSQWKTFISNRVSAIQELTNKEDWRHISTQYNPADIISRGLSAKQLSESNLWFSGPDWLSENSQHWPESQEIDVSSAPERKTVKLTFVGTNSDFNIFTRFSSLFRLQRVVAYILRFKNNALKLSSNKDSLTVQELQASLNLLVRLAQQQDFPDEIKSLKSSNVIKKKSRLLCLNPYLDENMLLRVGGRLKNSQVDYTQRHPIILSGNHPLTYLIIKQEHLRILHAGAQTLLASIRTRFWPLSGKNAVKKVLRQCITCFRVKPTFIKRLMGDLPAARVIPSRPFQNCGVDYAGPFNMKAGNLKSRKILKSYLCIFVCFVTKAVHLELVSDLTTNSFLNCFKRFISRRGKCSNIYSDNGTNFVGANNELKDMLNFLKDNKNQTKFSEYLSQHSITWHFIPARSPHMGGLWEACVKSAKYHLRRVVGNNSLTFEELNTIITQIEACMNSRPICPLSEDPNDLSPLTPGHFLIGDALTSLPQPDYQEINSGRLNRYQLLTQMLQHFWSRWSKEYLGELQKRSKWKSSDQQEISPNILVIIKEDNLPPLHWRLGRVTEIHPGKDGIVRVASVKTRSGVFKRAISKLCVLPIEN